MSELAPARLAELAARLEAHPAARVPLADVWRAFAGAFPGREPGVSERALLAAALRVLEAQGRCRLPADASWERSLEPPLPRFVRVVRAAAAPPDDAWRAFPWHPRLAWIPDLAQLAAAELAFLERVQAGLVGGWFAELAPLKYRSLQLTGHEKTLGRFAEGRLFAPGRLDLALLGCRPDPTPLVWRRVGDGRLAIVFENAGSYAVARDVLAGSRYGVVAFGDGNRFERSVLSLAEVTPLDAVHYVGDLDGAGLRIASAAARQARAAGLPRIEPATALHAAMLASAAAFGHAQGWPAERGAATGDALAFLDPTLRARVAAMLALGRRIPEEVLGPRELRYAIS